MIKTSGLSKNQNNAKANPFKDKNREKQSKSSIQPSQLMYIWEPNNLGNAIEKFNSSSIKPK